MHVIPEKMTLMEALERFFPDSSKRTLLHWIKFGRISVSGEVMKRKDHPLEEGSQLELHQKNEIPYFRGMKILYQDRWIVVIDKPSGLLSVGSDNPGTPHALGHLREYFGSPSIFAVHRIDRETSGILLFARGKESEERFDAMFEAHSLTRQYHAIVEGRLPQDEGTWQSYLLEKENYHVVSVPENEGKLAITHYKVYRRSKKFTYLMLNLETGRKHQIRVHCRDAGYTVCGDKRYGSTCNPAKRLCLHASLLSFVHPFTGKEMTFTSPLPREFITLGGNL